MICNLLTLKGCKRSCKWEFWWLAPKPKPTLLIISRGRKGRRTIQRQSRPRTEVFEVPSLLGNFWWLSTQVGAWTKLAFFLASSSRNTNWLTFTFLDKAHISFTNLLLFLTLSFLLPPYTHHIHWFLSIFLRTTLIVLFGEDGSPNQKRILINFPTIVFNLLKWWLFKKKLTLGPPLKLNIYLKHPLVV